MARIQLPAFGKILAQDTIKPEPVYLLYGSEPKRIADASKRLYQKLGGKAGADSCFHYLQVGPGAEDVAPGEIVGQLNTVSMFGGGKVVWAGPMGKPLKETMKTLVEYIENPNPGSTLILSITTPKGEKYPLADLDKHAVVKVATDNGTVVRFGPMSVVEMKKWVKNKVFEREVTIGEMAIDQLIELTNKDLDKLNGEIDKLCSYVGKGKEISMEAVEETVGERKETKVWDFTDALAKRDFGQAVIILNDLMDANLPPQMILKMMTGEISRMAVARGCKQNGESFDAYARMMGGSQYPLRKAWANANQWKDGELAASLRSILNAYMANMVGGSSSETAMATLLTQLPRSNCV